jgi:hypothetical protein
MFTALDHIPCAKLIIHHEPKNVEGMGDDKAYYGTTFWRNAPRLAWRLKREAKEETKSIIKATHHKANDDGESPPFTYSMDFPLAIKPVTLFVSVDEFEQSDEARIVDFMRGFDRTTLNQVVEGTGIAKTTAFRIVQELMGKNIIEYEKDAKHSQRLYLKFVSA